MNRFGFLCEFILISVVWGAAFWNVGPCPDSHKPGDTWRPHQDGCEECQCTENGYGCTSCGLVDFSFYRPRHNCYYEKVPASEPYPRCCDYDKLCPGNVHYNKTKYEILVSEFAFG